MSVSGEEDEEEEAWSREEDELIPRRSSNLHHSDERHHGGNGQIPTGKHQKPGFVSADLRKENDTKTRGFRGNRRKLQEKAEQIVRWPVGKLRKHLEGTKPTTETILRRSSAPFPYDGKDFGGSTSYRYICFRPPSIPTAPNSPRNELGTAAESPGGSTVVKAKKPNHSSHYLFVKSLIEKNQFYSPECNPHRHVTGSGMPNK